MGAGPGDLDWQRYQRRPDGWRKSEAPELPVSVRRYAASAVPTVPAGAMGEQDLERLRALGYLPPRDDAE